jgi:hypothetical protein
MPTKVQVRGNVSRDDVEAALWQWSGWQADQRLVDELLDVIDRYVQSAIPRPAQAMRPAPAPVRRAPVVKAAPVVRPAVVKVRVAEPVDPSLDTPRKCTQCGFTMALRQFNRDVKSRGGRKAQCKICENINRGRRRLAKKAKAAEVGQ